MERVWLLPAALLMALALRSAAAGMLSCTGILYLKTRQAGDQFNVSLTAMTGANNITVVSDLAQEPKAPSGKSWDDSVNSLRLMCTCTMGDCSADYPKVILRVFADPQFRKTGGGDNISIPCTASADMASCSGGLMAMPAKWGSRTSAVALLYDLKDYVLPLKKGPSTHGSSPKPSTPKPSAKPSSPKPSTSPKPGSPKPSTPTPAPKPSSPKPDASPKPSSPKPSSPNPALPKPGRNLLAGAASPKPAAPSPKHSKTHGNKPSSSPKPSHKPGHHGRRFLAAATPSPKPAAMACAALLAGLVLAVLASNAAAGSVDCTATLYQKTFFGGETFNISLLASGTPAKTVVYDLAKVPPAANGKSWDDILNSVRLLCTCTMGDCSADYPLLLLRVFAEPQYRMHNGGDNFTMACTASADGASCSNSRTAMPAGWGSRTSAVAVLYDMSAYVLPLKIGQQGCGGTRGERAAAAEGEAGAEAGGGAGGGAGAAAGRSPVSVVSSSATQACATTSAVQLSGTRPPAHLYASAPADQMAVHCPQSAGRSAAR
ncbi:hypothetical protein TSOC_003680 [Tetrabaena socialis]|uniref:Pherophorin domain-containing protein n=1 Tax=Tetrabaena socialis TaxID=47790 RepID=A0A2J8AB08_9CHLO|nr:hypothetical protein TSOC_003680 [Tetrabaena socialis]|eukprot:PNH09706.1 hypothetical protein TSOC_003680 [Tetrabaena socialis]